MLVELVLCPLTFEGAAVGSEKEVHDIGIQIFFKYLTKKLSRSEGSTGLKLEFNTESLFVN